MIQSSGLKEIVQEIKRSSLIIISSPQTIDFVSSLYDSIMFNYVSADSKPWIKALVGGLESTENARPKSVSWKGGTKIDG